MALRTSRVSLSPSTMAWHSRFSFSGKENKKKGHGPVTQTSAAPPQQEHNKQPLFAASGSRLPELVVPMEPFSQVLSVPGSVLSNCFSQCQQASRFSLLKITSSL